MSDWQVETSGSTTLVVRRHRGIQQELHRWPNGRIVWFDSKKAAQKVADELNNQRTPEQPE